LGRNRATRFVRVGALRKQKEKVELQTGAQYSDAVDV